MGGADLLHLPERTRKMLAHALACLRRIAGRDRFDDTLVVAHHAALALPTLGMLDWDPFEAKNLLSRCGTNPARKACSR
jgi:hypothetical protein